MMYLAWTFLQSSVTINLPIPRNEKSCAESVRKTWPYCTHPFTLRILRRAESDVLDLSSNDTSPLEFCEPMNFLKNLFVMQISKSLANFPKNISILSFYLTSILSYSISKFNSEIHIYSLWLMATYECIEYPAPTF